uniref:peroxidase n=1 Tax=Solanum lycopersicum TaxID=4081 RepID=A0A3Q7EEX0_SOLLC
MEAARPPAAEARLQMGATVTCWNHLIILTNVGAHTLGITHCYNIESRLYDDPKNDEPNEHEFKIYLKLSRPKGSLTSNISFVLNEPTTLTFDNHYYINAINEIDAKIPFHLLTTPYVQCFAADQDNFLRLSLLLLSSFLLMEFSLVHKASLKEVVMR